MCGVSGCEPCEPLSINCGQHQVAVFTMEASDSEKAGTVLITRAVELDNEGRYNEALTYYQTGIENLMSAMKGILDVTKKQCFRQRVASYMDRAEALKKHVEKLKEDGKYHEQINIANNSCGHGYRRIFGRLLDPLLTNVEVEDPYIRKYRQISNFLRFCEMVINSEAKVKNIKLITGRDDDGDGRQTQKNLLEDLSRSLDKRGIKLETVFSNTLHDREIRFNNGWIVKIGRGLDYFKAPESKFCIGYFDLDLRPCYETTVDIFNVEYTKKAS